MTNFGKYACALLISGGLAAPAFAADQTGASNGAGTANQTTNAGAANSAQMNKAANSHIAQRLRSDMTKAGFSDIRIMPSSFLVRAKDFRAIP